MNTNQNQNQNRNQNIKNNGYNGRVFIDAKAKPDADYVSRDECTRMSASYAYDAVKGNVTRDPVSDLFFSRENVDLLQLGIRNMVLNKSCGKRRIGNQSYEELLQIMRAIYLQDALHQPYEIANQVKQLNTIVLNYCLPRIMNELEMRDTFIKDIQKMPMPMSYGESTSVAGTKYLERKVL